MNGAGARLEVRGHSWSALVCDADPRVRRAVASALADTFDVIGVASHQEALVKCNATVALVLVDYDAPGLLDGTPASAAGLPLLSALRQRFPQAVRVVMSARHRHIHCAEGEAHLFVPKPLQLQTVRVIARVQHALISSEHHLDN